MRKLLFSDGFMAMLTFLVMIASLVVLSGCTVEPKNKDPRVGTVWLDEEACEGFWHLLYECGGAYKVCVGPDLKFDDQYSAVTARYVRNSKECER